MHKRWREAVVKATLTTLAGVLVSSVMQAQPMAAPDAFGRQQPPLSTEKAAGDTPNVLIIIADDLGVDRVAVYGEHPSPGNTPVIDALAQDGLLFRNAWSNPTCSPTRAAMLTGRHAFRNGIGRALGAWELAVEDTTLADLLSPSHETWAVGKWHLSKPFDLLHPLLQGFDHHHGTHNNLGGFVGNGYFNHWTTVDGAPVYSTTYATTETVDEAIGFIQGSNDPWFMWLGLHAPHSPFHKPPSQLHSFILPTDVAANTTVHHKAMVEAMDTELGRLFSTVSQATWDDTLIIFIGDNGTSGSATTAPFNPEGAKGTVYEGGINVPLIITGPGVVAGAECAALVSTTDLFATVAEFAGHQQSTGDDSVSLVPYFAQPSLPSLRSWVYSEEFTPLGFGPFDTWDQAARDDQYKLIRRHDESLLTTQTEFYDLSVDPFEKSDLLGSPLTPVQSAAYDKLTTEIKTLLGPWRLLGHSLASAPSPTTTHGSAQTTTPGPNPARTAFPEVHGSIAPRLRGTGPLLGGDAITLELQDTAAQASAILVVGFSVSMLPFQGGVLVPAPDLLLNAVTDAEGQLSLLSTWPMGVPSDTLVYLQHWILDPQGAGVHSASNGLGIITP